MPPPSALQDSYGGRLFSDRTADNNVSRSGRGGRQGNVSNAQVNSNSNSSNTVKSRQQVQSNAGVAESTRPFPGSAAFSRFKSSAISSYEQAAEAVSSSGPNNRRAMLVLLVVIALLVLIVIVAFIIFRVQRGGLLNANVIKSPINLTTMSSPLAIDQSLLPATLNGQEYAYSFWLYVYDYEKTASFKTLFKRGDPGTTDNNYARSSPLVFMDGSTNKLYILARTSMTPSSVTLADALDPANGFAIATVQYMPEQRWVHIMVSLKDSAMTVYFDGKLYTVVSVTDVLRANPTDANNGPNYRPTFMGTSGSVTIGQLQGGARCTAFLTRLSFYNYAMTGTDADAEYRQGPATSSVMGAIGLPEYGVRTPVYRVDN